MIRTPDEIEARRTYTTPEAWAARVEELLHDEGLVADFDPNDWQEYPDPDDYVQSLIDGGDTEDRDVWAGRMFGFDDDGDDEDDPDLGSAYDPRVTSFVVGMVVRLPGGGFGRVTEVGDDGFIRVQPDGGGQVQMHTADFLRSLRDS